MARYLIPIVSLLIFACSPNLKGVPSGILPVEVAKAKVSHGALLVDVRKPDEFSAGHVDGAINIPHDQIMQAIKRYADKNDQEIVLYSDSGSRANKAKESLEEHGYSRVYNAGGYSSWVR